LLGGFKQILSAVTKAQAFSIELLEQLFGFRCRHPYVWWGESSEFRGAFFLITKDKFISFTVALMGDLSKNFSKLEVMCPCGCGADKISPVLIEKLQKVRNIIGRPLIITSGVRCEFYNEVLKQA
jgi:Peptidase M15.